MSNYYFFVIIYSKHYYKTAHLFLVLAQANFGLETNKDISPGLLRLEGRRDGLLVRFVI